MTKKEIVRMISERTALTQAQTKEVVQRAFDAILDAIVEEGRIELRNFGVFELRHRPPRRARNPRTGEPVLVPAKNVVVFKPGRKLEHRIGLLAAGGAPPPPPKEGARRPAGSSV